MLGDTYENMITHSDTYKQHYDSTLHLEENYNLAIFIAIFRKFASSENLVFLAKSVKNIQFLEQFPQLYCYPIVSELLQILATLRHKIDQGIPQNLGNISAISFKM